MSDTINMYLRMVNDKGQKVYRNVVPSASSNKLTFNSGTYEGNLEDTASELASLYVPIQTEEPDVNNGLFAVKFVVEKTLDLPPSTLYNANPTVPGSDAWTDTSNEKLLLDTTDGNKTYRVTVPKAATAAFGTNSLADNVRDYANRVAGVYRTVDDEEHVTWTEANLTGTKESLLVRNS